jgi:hypothetical protein
MEAAATAELNERGRIIAEHIENVGPKEMANGRNGCRPTEPLAARTTQRHGSAIFGMGVCFGIDCYSHDGMRRLFVARQGPRSVEKSEQG